MLSDQQTKLQDCWNRLLGDLNYLIKLEQQLEISPYEKSMTCRLITEVENKLQRMQASSEQQDICDSTKTELF